MSGEGGARGTVPRRLVEEHVKQTELGGKGSTGGNWIGGAKTRWDGEHPIAQSEESAAQEEERDAAGGEREVIGMVRERSRACPALHTLKCTRRERWMGR